jgi:hypothetical protein
MTTLTDSTVARTAPYRTDLVTSLLGVWFMVGLMLDAWAHNTLSELETFFTPWHAVFYSGFLAIGSWIAWTVWPGVRNGRWDSSMMPRGYATAALALPAFALAAFGDLLWHTIFGIEQSIDILFSPTHLGLAAAMMVIVSTPLRSYLSAPPVGTFRAAFPAVLSISLAATLVLLFLQYANVLSFGPGTIWLGLSATSHDTDEVAAAFAVTNLVLIVPLLLLGRHGRFPLGAATVLYVLAAGLAGAITSFEFPGLTVSFVVAGVLVDVLGRALGVEASTPGRLRLFGFLAPLLTWSIYLVTANLLVDQSHFPPEIAGEPAVELWTGMPIVQGFLGFLAATVLVMAARPAAEQVSAAER